MLGQPIIITTEFTTSKSIEAGEGDEWSSNITASSNSSSEAEVEEQIDACYDHSGPREDDVMHTKERVKDTLLQLAEGLDEANCHGTRAYVSRSIRH